VAAAFDDLHDHGAGCADGESPPNTKSPVAWATNGGRREPIHADQQRHLGRAGESVCKEIGTVRSPTESVAPDVLTVTVPVRPGAIVVGWTFGVAHPQPLATEMMRTAVPPTLSSMKLRIACGRGGRPPHCNLRRPGDEPAGRC
jgi:hypothetical protein